MRRQKQANCLSCEPQTLGKHWGIPARELLSHTPLAWQIIVTKYFLERTRCMDSWGIIQDAYGKRAGTVSSTGIVQDAYGKRVGTVSSTGIIQDAYGKRVGTVSSSSISAGGAALLLLLEV